MEAIETINHNGLTIEILPDFDASHCNPRHDCNLGTIWTQDSRYMSPDKMPMGGNVFDSVAQTLGGTATHESNVKALDRKTVWLPVWKYEHSGVVYCAATSNPFHCPWDSGQVGYVFVTLGDVRKEYGVARVTKAIRAKALDVLKAEVDAYSQWAGGDVYGYRILVGEGEELDSCWGFLGMENAIEVAKEAA